MPWPSYGSIQAREHLATLLEQMEVPDISGNAIEWVAQSPPVQCYVKLLDVRADDNIRAGQNISEVWKFVYARGPRDGGPVEGLVATARFSIETGDTFIIKGISDIENRGVLLKLSCVALGPND